jgi:hypothetical protein
MFAHLPFRGGLSRFSLEVIAPSRAEYRAAMAHYATHVTRSKRDESALNQACVTVADTKHFDTARDPGTHHCPDGRIHPRRVPTARKHRKSRHAGPSALLVVPAIAGYKYQSTQPKDPSAGALVVPGLVPGAIEMII